MRWDNGQGLSLIPGKDSFRKLTEQEIADEQKAASFESVGPVPDDEIQINNQIGGIEYV